MIADQTPHVSIVIPTRNGMPLLRQCLEQVLRQETAWPFEVIVIDSSSTDGTWEFLGTLPVKRLRIHPREFNHGGTRNLGAEQARGEFLVFLVQDAVPADRRWLANLVAACDQPRVAGAYSRQLPRPDSTLITRYMALATTPTSQQRIYKALPPGATLASLTPPERFRLVSFNNVSSCMHRSLWRHYPFTILPYGEDLDWGKRVVEAGHTIVYEPTSAVYHSHDRSPYYTLKRAYADHYQVSQLFGWTMTASLPTLLRITASSTARAVAYVLSSDGGILLRARSGITAPLFMAALAIGQYLGQHALKHGASHRLLATLDKQLRSGV